MEEIDRGEGREHWRSYFNNGSCIVWGRLTYSELENILSRSDIPVQSSLNDLLQRLSNKDPILIDNGRMSFFLDTPTGSKCFTLPARELSITWGDNSKYWKWKSHPDSRLGEVAELHQVCWLDISGKLKTIELSPNTTYVAYLIFKLTGDSFGFERQNQRTSLIVGDRETREVVRLEGENANRQRLREDGWYEVVLGEFFNETGNDKEVVVNLFETEVLNWKGGLLVQGIEFRP